MKFLCIELGVSRNHLEYVLSNLNSMWSEWTDVKIDRVSGNPKTYKDGTEKKRTLRPSRLPLKILQRAIFRMILSKVELPDNIHGGVKGRSNITNAKKHQGKPFIFTTDLKDFYPSVTNHDVYKIFLSLGYSNHAASILTKLTTCKGQLPQGASTSGRLADIAFLDTDRKLIAVSALHGLVYTRYVDDLTFSSSRDFKISINEILLLISKAGFWVNYRKTFYKSIQEITGICVHHNFSDVPDRIKEKSEAENGEGPVTRYVNQVRATNSAKTIKSRAHSS